MEGPKNGFTLLGGDDDARRRATVRERRLL
jgi:hypothetical protein